MSSNTLTTALEEVIRELRAGKLKPIECRTTPELIEQMRQDYGVTDEEFRSLGLLPVEK